MDAERLTGQLVLWLRERVEAARSQGIVLGISGGIDSSVLAVICQRAFPRSTLGVIMPCHSQPEDEEHARAVASKFSILTRVVVLDSVFDTLIKALPHDEPDQTGTRLAEANLKARLRMLTLYYFANGLNYVVAGSGNRSELAIGYFTKFGDSGVDILPLGNLVKSEVRELARFLDIPPVIIDKPPSAGLWVGQTDESEMGFSYEALDRYLTTGEAPAELKKKIDARIEANKHKRQTPPLPDFPA